MTVGVVHISDRLASPAACLDTAARLLLEVFVAEGRAKLAARSFLVASCGLDREAIVAAGAERLRAGMENRAPQTVVEAVIWSDLERIFRWRRRTRRPPCTRSVIR